MPDTHSPKMYENIAVTTQANKSSSNNKTTPSNVSPDTPITTDNNITKNQGQDLTNQNNQTASFNETDIDTNTRNLLNLIRSNLSLPNLETPLVAQDEEWYRLRPDYVKRMLERSKRYLYYIVSQVKARNMPMEIALLPMVESGFNPKALSSSNASGIWQFIPETGRDFGLNQNHWMDERRDIKAATNAALTYLQHLHSDLGNWYLALAAYNCGEGLVNQLIAQQRARNLPTDYLSLPLPAQTKNYVPKLLAVRDIIKHPEKYGLETDFIPNKAYFKSVELNEPLDVYQAARLAKISINEFRALNPAYTHSFIPKASGAILLPVNQVAIFKENIKNYDNPLKDWGKYFTRPGEPLIRVALQTGTTVQMIARVNGLPNNAYFRFRNRQVVLTPPLRKTYVARYHSGDYTYKVRPGDTMYGIAKAHDINLQRLIALNEGRTHLSLGETIHLPYFSHTKGLYRSGQHNIELAKKNTERRFTNTYKVRPGDTLYKIALARNISLKKLIEMNKGRTILKPGETLYITKSTDPIIASRNHLQKHVQLTHYTVRRGDTLDSIAHRFKVNIHDIERWNKIPKQQILHPGDHVMLYGG